MDKSYSLVKVKAQNTVQVCDFVCKNYIIDQPLSLFWKTNSQQFLEVYGQLIRCCCRSDLSYMLKKDQQIISTVLMAQYQECMKPIPVPEYFSPISSIFAHVQQCYIPEDPKKSLYLYVACTLPDHRRKGLFQKLAQIAQIQAKQKGYVEILSDCSNPNSANPLKKIGYQEKVVVYYKDYEYKGVKFDKVQGSEKLLLLSKHISSKNSQQCSNI